MGWLTLHLERRLDSESWEYAGAFDHERNYALFHLLGFPHFAKYAPVTETKLARAKSYSELPHDATDRVMEIAEELSGNDEATWRWTWAASILSLDWETRIGRSEVAGPIDYKTYLETGRGRARPTVFYEQLGRSLAERGLRCVANDEMAELIRSDPSVLEDEAQLAGNVYTLLETSTTLADSLGFRKGLEWLRDTAGEREARVVMWAEI